MTHHNHKICINLLIPGFVSQIYTEWANYYLERHQSKRTVGDLSTDCRDGLLLAEVIEAVTTFKVPDLIKKPKSQQQMVSVLLILCLCKRLVTQLKLAQLIISIESVEKISRNRTAQQLNDAINLNLSS